MPLLARQGWRLLFVMPWWMCRLHNAVMECRTLAMIVRCTQMSTDRLFHGQPRNDVDSYGHPATDTAVCLALMQSRNHGQVQRPLQTRAVLAAMTRGRRNHMSHWSDSHVAAQKECIPHRRLLLCCRTRSLARKAVRH